MVMLTSKQGEVVRLAADLIARGEVPSNRAMAEVLGITHVAVHYRVRGAMRKGYLRRGRAGDDRLRLTAKGRAWVWGGC